MADINVEIINPPVFEITLPAQGPQGLRGERGAQGPQGAAGATGPQGPKGDKGDSAFTFSVGSVEALPEGEAPYVEDVGEDGNVVLDFGFPRGAVGPSGRGVGIGAISLSLSKVPSDGFLHTWGETISREDNLDLYQACVNGTLPTINASNGGVTTIYAPNGIFKKTSGTNTLDFNEDVVMELAKIGGVVNWNAIYNTKPTGVTLASFRQNVETQILMFTEGGLNGTYFRLVEGPYSGRLAQAPSNPVNNTLYFNTTDKTYYIFEGGSWNQYGAEGVGYIYLGAMMVLTEPSTATWNDAAFVETTTTTTGLSQYDLELANNNGNCGYFGLDTTELSVRVPTLHDVFLKEDETNVGHYTPITINHTPSTDGYISLYYYVCVDKYTSLEQGPYFIPSVSNDGIISWTNNGGLANPTPRDITGPRGERGYGVTGVELISTEGLEKTYRMNFSDGSYFDYVVTDAAGAIWGNIAGSLPNQTDLQEALNEKVDNSDMVIMDYVEAPFYQKSEVYTKTEADNRYVNVTGDTMTGALNISNSRITCNQTSNTQPIHINHSSSNGFVSIYNKANDMDFTSTTAPSANQMAHRFLAFDKNGQHINTIETAHLTNNNFQTLISTRRSIDGAVKTVNLAQVITPTGTTNTFINGSPLEVQNDTFNFVARAATMDITQTPANNQYVGFEIRDKNNARCAYIGVVNRTSGNKELDVQLHGTNILSIAGMTSLYINSKNVPYVTDHVVSGTSWYELWSDGWIRQGGRFIDTSTKGNITFLKTFTNTNYSLTVTTYETSTTDDNGTSTAAFPSDFTVNGFRYSKNNEQGIIWTACGK